MQRVDRYPAAKQALLGIIGLKPTSGGTRNVGKCDFISSDTAAGICLENMSFPATKQDIVDRIEESGGAEAAIVAINQVPDRTYYSLEELVRCLEGGQ